jgi:hypothetical protein
VLNVPSCFAFRKPEVASSLACRTRTSRFTIRIVGVWYWLGVISNMFVPFVLRTVSPVSLSTFRIDKSSAISDCITVDLRWWIRGAFTRSQNNLHGLDCSVILQVWCRLIATLGQTARGRVLQSTTNWIVIWPYIEDPWIVEIMPLQASNSLPTVAFPPDVSSEPKRWTRKCKTRLLSCYR